MIMMTHALISLSTATALMAGGVDPRIATAQPQPMLTMRMAQPAPSEAAAPAPAPAPAAAAEPAPAADPAEALAPAAAEPAPAAAPAPAPTVTLQPASESAPAPATPAPAASAGPAPRAGVGLIVAGSTMTALGGISLLFVAVPASIVRDVAQNRADDDDPLAFSSRQTRYARARRADDTMEAAFWIGAPLLVGGIAVLIAGVVTRTRYKEWKREQVQVGAAPGGLSVRF